MRKAALIALALLLLSASVGLAQSTTNVTVEWTHDGVNTTGYAIIVDGVRTDVRMTPTCTGTGAARVCDVPFTLTNATHTVQVEAYNTTGKATSDVFAWGGGVSKPGMPTIKITVQIGG